jgi:hypothetical protein
METDQKLNQMSHATIVATMGTQPTSARFLFVATAYVPNQSTNRSIAPREDPAIPGNELSIGSLQSSRPV